MTRTRLVRERAALAVLLLVAGCGVTLPWSTSSPPDGGGGGAFTVTPGSISVRANLGGPTPAPVTLALGLTGTAYLAADRSGAAVATASVDDVGGRAVVTVTFPAPTATGARTGTVTVTACRDVYCKAPVPGSPRTIPVTYTVEQGLSATPTRLSAQWLRGDPVPSLDPIALSEPGVSSGSATASVTWGEGAPGWLAAESTTLPGSSRITLIPPGADLAPGVYTAAVRYTSGTGRTVDVPVSLTVQDPPSPFRSNPAALEATWTRGAAVPALPAVELRETGVTAGMATVSLGFQTVSGWLTATPSGIPGLSSVSLTPEGMPPGVHRATVRYTSGTGRSVDVPVTLTVREGTVSATPARLAFDAVIGASPPRAQTATLARGAGPAAYVVAVEYGSGPAGWLAAPALVSPPQDAVFVPTTTALAAGTYTATVRFQSGDGVVCGTLPVSYAVTAPTLADPPDRVITVTPATVAADLSGSAPVDVSGGLALPWTARSSAGWLVLDRVSGTAGVDAVAYHVDPAVLGSLAYGASMTAAVTVTTSTPALTQSFGVTLTGRVPEVRYVMPSVQVAGKASRVRVRGVGFEAIADPSALEPVEGVTGAKVTRLSDAVLVVDLPPVAAGERKVRIPTALAGAARGAALLDVDPEALPSARVGQIGLKHPLLLDARRRAVLTVNADQSAIVRFAQVAGAWSPVVRSIAGLKDLGLSPDGNLLVAVAGNSVRLLDAATLADVEAYTTTSSEAFSGTNLGLATMNDGRVVLPGRTYSTSTIAVFDLWTRTFGTIDTTGIRLEIYNGPWYAASRDGERVLIVQSASLSPPPPGLYVDATYGKVSVSPGPATFYDGSLSDDGSRFVTGLTVYDGYFGTIGAIGLPAFRAGGSAYVHETSVMSPDGSHVYALAYPPGYLDGTSGTATPRVFVFDTRTVPTGGPALPLLRSFDVEWPSCRSSSYPCNHRVLMGVTPDDQTLFLLGSEALLVVPVQ